MKIKRSICICLCILAVCPSVLTACNSEGATPDEASTASVQTESTGTADNKTAETIADTKVGTTADKAKNSDNAPTQNGRPVDSDDAQTDNSAKPATITVGNKDHSVKVGETVTYTCYLTTPKRIENVQASVTYDGSVLRIKDTDAAEMFPVLSDSAVYNTGLEGTVKFNASKPSGIDFTKKGVLISLEFQVVKSGTTSIATALEYMDEKGGEPYVDLYKIVGDITCEEVLSE